MDELNKEFNPGQIVWFYYDSIIPCQKGEIVNYIKDDDFSYYNVNWIEETSSIDGREFKSGISGVLPKNIFKTKDECLKYVEELYDIKKNKIKEQINSKEELLQFMINCIWSEDYDYVNEIIVIKEKIKEYFSIELE